MMKIRCVNNRGNENTYTKDKIYDFEPGKGLMDDDGKVWELVEDEVSEFEQLYNDSVSLRKKVEELEAEVEKTKKLADSRVLFCEKQSDEFQEENECLKKKNLQLKDRVKFFEEEERKKGLILEDQARLLKSMAEEIDRYKKYSSGLVSYIHKNIPKLEDFDCEE